MWLDGSSGISAYSNFKYLHRYLNVWTIVFGPNNSLFLGDITFDMNIFSEIYCLTSH